MHIMQEKIFYKITHSMKMLKNLLSKKEIYIEDIARVLELCKNAYNLYLSKTDEEKRKLVNLLCSNLSFDVKNVVITLKSVFNIFVENASCRLNLEVIDKIRTDYYFDVLELKDFIKLFMIQLS